MGEGAKDPEEARIRIRRRRRRKGDPAKGEEEDKARRRGREAMGGTAWEIAREALSPPALNSAPESSELEYMAFVLPPVISDADSMLTGIVLQKYRTSYRILLQAPCSQCQR